MVKLKGLFDLMKRSFECPKAATFRLQDFKKCQKLALLSLEVNTVLRYSLLRFRAIVIFGQDRYIFKKKFWLLDKFITCPIDIFWRTFSTNNVETRQRYRQEAIFRTHIIFLNLLKDFLLDFLPVYVDIRINFQLNC